MATGVRRLAILDTRKGHEKGAIGEPELHDTRLCTVQATFACATVQIQMRHPCGDLAFCCENPPIILSWSVGSGKVWLFILGLAKSATAAERVELDRQWDICRSPSLVMEAFGHEIAPRKPPTAR